jgi:hypothetical protein
LLLSTLLGIYSSSWPSWRSCRVEQQQPYSYHNTVMSVATKHTHLYNSYHKHLYTHRAGGNKTGSVSTNLSLGCIHLTTGLRCRIVSTFPGPPRASLQSSFGFSAAFC